MNNYLILIFISAAVVILFVIKVLFEKKRNESLKYTSQIMGFLFSDREEFRTLGEAASFRLFQRGRRKRLRNVMSKTAGGTQQTVFDYQYTTGGGKNQHTHRQTVS